MASASGTTPRSSPAPCSSGLLALVSELVLARLQRAAVSESLRADVAPVDESLAAA